MRTRHHIWTDRILAILARAAELWLHVVFRLVFAPGLRNRLRTREDVDEVMRQLYRADAHITRAIYKTARRLAGLPRIPCPIEAFYRPPLKTADHVVSLYLDCEHKLTHHRTRAARMAWRWLREDERSAHDPLCDLRGDRLDRLPRRLVSPKPAGAGGSAAKAGGRLSTAHLPN